MSDTNWKGGPVDAQAWAPSTKKFMAGWYKTDDQGRWYFAQSRAAGWWAIERPSTYRQRQMERRP